MMIECDLVCVFNLLFVVFRDSAVRVNTSSASVGYVSVVLREMDDGNKRVSFVVFRCFYLELLVMVGREK